jgi:hypothetical protein
MAQESLKITPVGGEPKGFNRLFEKRVDVIGVTIFATARTADAKVLHAANVLAQYLDNDADGQPDNRRVVEALRKRRAAIIMFATEREAESIFEDLEEEVPTHVLDAMGLQDLYGSETHPGGAGRGVFDASYEEVLHLITHYGYASVYPEVFGEKPGTQIAECMDMARGGRFRRVPRRYPKGAWYTYDDRTCDYSCQITEYVYWGLTSILGAQDFRGRLDEISQEWRLNSADKVRQHDPALYKLLTDPAYALPTKLPDGKYSPRPAVKKRDKK